MEGLDAELDAEKGQVPPTMHTMATLGSLVLLGFALTKTRSNYTSAKMKTSDYLDISTYISLNYLHQQAEASFYKVWPMLGLKWTYSKNACTTPTSSFDDSNSLRVPYHLAEELNGLDAWKSHDGNQEQRTYSHHLSQTGKTVWTKLPKRQQQCQQVQQQLAHVSQGHHCRSQLWKRLPDRDAMMGFPSQIESRLSSQTHSKSKTESCSGHLTEVIDFAGRVPSGTAILHRFLGWSTYCRYRNSGEVAWSHHHRRANP